MQVQRSLSSLRRGAFADIDSALQAVDGSARQHGARGAIGSKAANEAAKDVPMQVSGCWLEYWSTTHLHVSTLTVGRRPILLLTCMGRSCWLSHISDSYPAPPFFPCTLLLQLYLVRPETEPLHLG